MMDCRLAAIDDVPLLARMNRELVEDEQHRNRFHMAPAHPLPERQS